MFSDTKEAMRACKLKRTESTMAKKDRKYNGKKGQKVQWQKRKIIIHKTLHRKHESHKKRGLTRVNRTDKLFLLH